MGHQSFLQNLKFTRYQKGLLYIFPILYLLIGFYFRQVFGDLSLRSIDPEYIHFVSGLSVSVGKFTQANIDQPAAILHLMLALVFRVVYFFRPHSATFFQDIIIHSDLYLGVANLVITALIGLFMFWAGQKIFKITGNIVYGVLIQCSPFLLPI